MWCDLFCLCGRWHGQRTLVKKSSSFNRRIQMFCSVLTVIWVYFGLVFNEVMSPWKQAQCCLFAVSVSSLVSLGAQVGVCFAVMLFFVCGLHRHGVHGLRAQCEELQEFQCGNPLDGLCDDTVGGGWAGWWWVWDQGWPCQGWLILLDSEKSDYFGSQEW